MRYRPLLLSAILSLFILIGGFILYVELRDDFSLANISPEKADHLGWALPSQPVQPPQDLDLFLNRSYSYLGKGHQSYAFISDDGKYVLKFIKFTYLKPSRWPSWLPPYKKQSRKGQLKRLQRVLIGYDLAFKKDQENTGVSYIHFQKTDYLNKKIQVIDKYGFSHTIDLDQVYFILQKKASVTRDLLKFLLKNQRLPLAKQRIRQILDLYVSEYKKGLYDTDHNVMSNTGFIDGHPIRLDVGRLKFDPEMQKPEFFKADLEKISSQRLRKWIKKNFPQYYDELAADIESKMNEILK